MFTAVALIILVQLPFPARAPALRIEYPEVNRLIIIQDNSLVAISSYLAPLELRVLGCIAGDWTKDDVIAVIKERYPEKAHLLTYMVKDESTYCLYMRGDSGLAYGCFQIHLDKHDITEECAMDFLCSLDWTVKKIEEGKGYLWTSYRKYYGMK